MTIRITESEYYEGLKKTYHDNNDLLKEKSNQKDCEIRNHLIASISKKCKFKHKKVKKAVYRSKQSNKLIKDLSLYEKKRNFYKQKKLKTDSVKKDLHYINISKTINSIIKNQRKEV